MSDQFWKRAATAIHETVVKRWPVWSDEDRRFLALALTGEVGELTNLIKKQWRGDFTADDPRYIENIREELADAQIYLYLCAEAHEIDLDQAATAKIAQLVTRWPETAKAVAECVGLPRHE